MVIHQFITAKGSLCRCSPIFYSTNILPHTVARYQSLLTVTCLINFPPCHLFVRPSVLYVPLAMGKHLVYIHRLYALQFPNNKINYLYSYTNAKVISATSLIHVTDAISAIIKSIQDIQLLNS